MRGPDMIKKFLLSLLISLLVYKTAFSSITPSDPIVTDSRIKTLIYSNNEVFRVVLHYGYQTTIEFEEDEKIKTVNTGSAYAWQMNPSGRTLIIRPLEENIMTNMSVQTNKRSYQFEIVSRDLDSGFIDDEFAYLIRFIYPKSSEELESTPTSIDSKMPDIKGQVNLLKTYNFNYKVIGVHSMMPKSVFDDGVSTFFEYQKQGSDPIINVLENGKQYKVNIRKIKNFYIVDRLASTWLIYDKNEKVIRVVAKPL